VGVGITRRGWVGTRRGRGWGASKVLSPIISLIKEIKEEILSFTQFS
jgi:hypothetical protein